MNRDLEIRFQSELWRILHQACSRGPIGGFNLRALMNEPRFDSKVPDIVVVKEPEGAPILIIETKRKSKGKYRYAYRFTPYDPSIIAQAFSYAALAKENYKLSATPLFATANPDVLVLFSPVDNPWRLLNRKAVEEGDYENALEPGAYMQLIRNYYIFDERAPLREEFIFKVLDTVVRLWKKEVEVVQIRKEIGLWLIDQLRYFVDYMDEYYVREPLRIKLQRDNTFYGELDGLARMLGYSNGLADIVGSDLSKVKNLSRMMVYVLMNKIVFYKVLENYYKLPRLEPFAHEVKSTEEYLYKLNNLFEKAIDITGNFEQIFRTGLYDKILISDEFYARQQIDELIRILSEVDLQEFGDIIGHVYEGLIPEEERHRLGQFYTPRPIAELITKWCIRSGDDVVLGPGCGSGTFEVEAYWRLVEFKTGRRATPSKDVHEKVLRQIYALDINSFPTQLTAMNLAMKNVRAPITDLNIIESDFFSIIPGQEILMPYVIQTPEGPKQKKIVLPKEGFDAVFGNPPYTRWTEIPDLVKDNIRKRLREVLSKYDLHADVARGKEPGIYIHFIMWAREFLKPGGRLGMIISDSWLQAIYGENFGRYLLENFKVKALIDISARVFPVPLIGTCILLLEKPREGERIEDNEVVLLYLSIPEGASFKVDEILQAIQNPQEAASRYWIKTYRQGAIPKEQRWINLLFPTQDLLRMLENSDCMKKLSEYFDVSYGNIGYLVLSSLGKVKGVRNVGGEDFFYLTYTEAERRGLVPDWVYPLLPSSDCMRFYTFTKEDWENIRRSDRECYLFLAHKPRNELPKNVQDYIAEGETSIFLRKGKGEEKPKTVNLSQASKARAKNPQYFYGWYDLGEIYRAPIYITRGSQYLARFVLSKFPVALDDRILALFLRESVALAEVEIKALLAFLNSSWTQLQVEVKGRITGGGMLELDIKPLSDLLVIDPKKLDNFIIARLAELFDKLETEARKLGGADTKENSDKLFETVIKEIDYAIADILGFSELVADGVRTMVKVMMERRLARAGEARRDAIKGSSEEMLLQKPRKKKKSKIEKRLNESLNDYLK